MMGAMRRWTGGGRDGTLDGGLGCEVCGRLPAPPRTRLTLANLAVMVPIELVVNAAAVRRRSRLGRAPALWRIRTVLRDEPGALERLARALARAQANILDIQVHPMGEAVLDELVASAPEGVTEGDVAGAVAAGGGREVRVWPTTALALADTGTQALSLAVRVAADPEELPLAAAELLRARVLDPGQPQAGGAEGTVLKVPSVRSGALVFSRPGEPFTPAERARAHRLAQLAETVELGRAHRGPR